MPLTNVKKVNIVGAGPGGIGYLTTRAKEILASSDVVVYDALVDPDLLDCCADYCLKIKMGKRGSQESSSQEQINQILIKYCLAGKQVTRLKSGDPLVFGRIIQEVQALKNAGCHFEIIPGLSSALVAPMLAGIALSDLQRSGSFTILSGHQPDSLDWNTLAKLDTLVVLMGGVTLAKIVESLLRSGSRVDLPIAIICNCARSNQQIYRGTLQDILAKVAGLSLSPCIIVIGEVVAGERLMCDSLPLAGKRVLVTRAIEGSKIFRELLQSQGANVLDMPALEITEPSCWQPLDQALEKLPQFDWLILTSANAVEYFLNRLVQQSKDLRDLACLKIAVVGKKTAEYLIKERISPDFIPPDYIADSLIENFPEDLRGKKILFPRVESGGRDILVKELTKGGAEVVEVAAYESKSPKDIPDKVKEALINRQIDIITFASSKTVANSYHLFEKHIPSFSLELLEGVRLASIGPETSKACQIYFARVDIEAGQYTLEGLVAALGQSYA
jgi:uroporphyrinogen III methyltransferase / synthase